MTASLRMAFGAAIFVTASVEAQAFDCGKARSNVEIAICANPDLIESDNAMAEVYLALRNSYSSAEKRSLSLSERRWVAAREALCGNETGAAQVQCIARETEERKLLFTGRSLTGPGPSSRMAPVFLVQQPGPQLYEVDFALIRFAEPQTPGETLFNREVEKLIAAAPMGRTDTEAPAGGYLSSTAIMKLTYASPQFISAAVSFSSFDGGAHGNSSTTNLNVDLNQGRLADAAALFDGAAQDRLFEDCKKQIISQKIKNWPDGEYKVEDDSLYSGDTVRQHIGDLSRWSFSQSTTSISFDAYSVGAYAEGPFACEFDTRLLREAANDNFPVE